MEKTLNNNFENSQIQDTHFSKYCFKKILLNDIINLELTART